MRILPTGEVISDSHNFRKNETAARRIERELQLNSPSQQPSPTASGDRRAMQNASRMADRKGIASPLKISAQAVREALGGCNTHNEYSMRLLLLTPSIETFFDKHGAGTTEERIFGYKLRIVGTEVWIKASTLAKDLSWPKISHRFVNNIQEEVESQSSVSTATSHQTKIPMMLKPFLIEPNVIDGAAYTPAEQHHEKKSLVNALSLLGDVLSKCTYDLANLVINFLKKALNFLFGINTKLAATETQIFHPDDAKFALRLEPILPTTHDEQAAIKLEAKAGAWINKISQAIIAKNSFLLPDGVGKEVIIEQMKFEETPLSALKVAAEHFNSAVAQHQRASKKVDERPMDWVEDFEAKLNVANENLDSLMNTMQRWRGSSMKNSLLALTGKGKQREFDQQIKTAQDEVNFCADELKNHRHVLAVAQKIHDEKPLPRPSANIVKARDDAHIALRNVSLRVRNNFKFKFKSFDVVENARLEKLLASATTRFESFARETNDEFLLKGLAEYEALDAEIAFGFEKIRIKSERLAWLAKNADGQVKADNADELPPRD